MSIRRDLRTIPNLISLSRILLIFTAVFLYTSGFKGWGLLLGIIAGLTDYFDGILARKLNQVTPLGALLDLFSDLLFEAAALLLLVLDERGQSPLVLYIYLFREFWVVTIRQWMESQQLNIASSFIGKLKTNFFGWSFAFWFAYLGEVYPPFDTFFIVVGCIGLYGGLFFSYLSAWSYTKQFIEGYNRVVGGLEQTQNETPDVSETTSETP